MATPEMPNLTASRGAQERAYAVVPGLTEIERNRRREESGAPRRSGGGKAFVGPTAARRRSHSMDYRMHEPRRLQARRCPIPLNATAP